MANALRTLPASLLCLVFGACQPAGAPPTPAAAASAPAAVEAPAATPPTPGPAPGSTAYACDGGVRLVASFGEREVSLRWPDGRNVTLPRAESASGGDGDVYVGETVSLQRDGDHFQLHDAGSAATACKASGDHD